MKALTWNDSYGLRLIDRKEPQLKTKLDIKIKILYTGICGSDLQVIKRNQQIVSDIILGHEAVGEVVEIGGLVTDYQVGDMVVIDPNQYCCDCYYCKKGLTNFCEYHFGLAIAGINMDGTFAEYFVCHQRYIYKIPKEMEVLDAVLIEPMACTLNNIQAANIKEGETVLVLGSGPMGALCQMLCKQKARLVVGTENSKFRKEYCSMFADYIVSSDDLTTEKIRELTDGRNFDVVIDTVGTQMEYALKVIGKNGRILPMAMNRKYSFALKPYELIEKGIKLIGASEYNMLFVDTIHTVSHIRGLKKLITNEYPLEQYQEAFESILGSSLDLKQQKEITELKVVFKL